MTREEKEDLAKKREAEKLEKIATQKALDASISKWIAIRNREADDLGASNCPLCRKFHPKFKRPLDVRDECLGCPVREKTGLPRCDGTPYNEFREHWKSAHPRTFARAQCDECIHLVENMIQFLTELKPK